MANIARFHRKKLPSKKALRESGLDEKTKESIAILSTFLRFAEKLDRSHCGLVKKAEFIKDNKISVLLIVLFRLRLQLRRMEHNSESSKHFMKPSENNWMFNAQLTH